MAKPAQDPTRQILRELSALIRALTRVSGGPDEELPLTATQKLALYELYLGGPMRLNDLASRMGITAPSASRTVDALVELGLVDRLTDPDDRRALRLALTANGQGRASEREARVAEALAPAVATLTTAERAQLTALLARLADQVRP
jgi:DNA-binding MarR family transcriptional regulator